MFMISHNISNSLKSTLLLETGFIGLYLQSVPVKALFNLCTIFDLANKTTSHIFKTLHLFLNQSSV